MNRTSIQEAKMKLALPLLMEQLALREHVKRSAPPEPPRCEPAISPKSEYGNSATSINNTDKKALAALAALPPLEYERQRELQAMKLGCRVAMLDKLVEAERGKANGTRAAHWQ